MLAHHLPLVLSLNQQNWFKMKHITSKSGEQFIHVALTSWHYSTKSKTYVGWTIFIEMKWRPSWSSVNTSLVLLHCCDFTVLRFLSALPCGHSWKSWICWTTTSQSCRGEALYVSVCEWGEDVMWLFFWRPNGVLQSLKSLTLSGNPLLHHTVNTLASLYR